MIEMYVKMKIKLWKKCKRWVLFNMKKVCNSLERKKLDNRFWNIMDGEFYTFLTNSYTKDIWVGQNSNKNWVRQS